MQEQADGSVVFRQPVWKRILLLVISIAFVAGGILIIVAGNWLLGIICVLFFGACGVLAIRKSLTTLIADREGIVPVFFLKKTQHVKIPWSQVVKMDIVTQTISGGTKQRSIAFYLTDPEIIRSLSAMNRVSAELTTQFSGALGMSDGAKADMYIPSIEFAGSLEKVMEKLNSLRPSAPAVSQPAAGAIL